MFWKILLAVALGMLEGAAAVYFRENYKALIAKTETSSPVMMEVVAICVSVLLIAAFVSLVL